MSELYVPKGWELKPLDTISLVERGISWSKPDESKNPSQTSIPVLRIGNVRERKLDLTNLLYLQNQEQKKILKNKVSKNDILIVGSNGNRNLVGRSCILEKDMNFVFASFLMSVKKISDEIDPNFLFYYLNSPNGLGYIQKSTSSGVGINNLKISDLRKLPVVFPKNKSEQKKIIQKLDHIFLELDEKSKEIFSLIEKNKERIDFFKKNWLSYIIDSEIEKHPKREEWKISIIKNEITDFEKRNPEKTPEQEFKYVEIGSVSDNKKIENFKTLLGKDAPSRARNVIRENDVIYGTTRPYYRNVVLIPKEFDNEICSTGFCVLRSDVIDSEFLFFYMLSNFVNFKILKPMRGGNYPAVSNSDVTSIEIPLPSNSIQKQIVRKIKSTEEKFKKQKTQFENITQNYESRIKYINHIQSSVLDFAFSGKLVN